MSLDQGLLKGAILFQKPYFCFLHGEITSTASQLTSPASQKSKDLNKVLLLLQDLDPTFMINCARTGFSIKQPYQNLEATLVHVNRDIDYHKNR